MSNLKGTISGTQTLNGGSAINIAVTPNITIGEVATLEPNSSVVVELAENSTKINPVFNFGIPKGEKGEKGDAGSVKFIIVNELPTEDIDESAIYMKKIESEDAQNTYEEYIYVNGVWELLGTANVQVDLSDYVKKTDKADNTKLGIVQGGLSYGTNVAPSGVIALNRATNEDIDKKTQEYKPIVPSNLNYAVGSVLPVMTQAQYDALETKDENLYYFIVEE